MAVTDSTQGDQKRLAKRSALNFTGLAIASASQLALVIVLARGFTQHQAGVFFEGFAALKLLVVLATLGLDVTAVRYVAVHKALNDPRSLRGAVRTSALVAGGVSVAVALFVIVLAGPAASVFHARNLAPVLQILAIGLPFAVLQAVFIGATRGTGRMQGFVFVDQILDGVLRLAAVSIAAALGASAQGAALACTVSGILTCAAALYVARPLLFGGGSINRAALHGLLRFTAFQWGTVMAGTGTLWADSLLLGIWRPPADVAAYSVATRTVMLGLVFIMPISIAFQPMIARLHALGDLSGLRTMYAYATRWATLVGCPPLILVALLASPLLTVFYGHNYARAAIPLAVLALAQTANAATGPCGYIVTMVGRTDLTLQVNVTVLTTNLILNVILIPPFGMTGAGIAWAVSVLLSNSLRLVQAWRSVGIHPFDRHSARVGVVIGVFTAVAGLASFLASSLRPLLELVAVTASRPARVCGRDAGGRVHRRSRRHPPVGDERSRGRRQRHESVKGRIKAARRDPRVRRVAVPAYRLYARSMVFLPPPRGLRTACRRRARTS